MAMYSGLGVDVGELGAQLETILKDALEAVEKGRDHHYETKREHRWIR